MNTRKTIFKVCRLALAVALAIGATVGLSACKSDEQEIRASVETMLNAFKNPTKENLSPYMSEADKDSAAQEQLKESGIDFYEFLAHALKHFDYKINEVKVEGNTATVKLDITNTNIRKAMAAARSDVSNMNDEESMQLYQNGDTNALIKKLMESLYKHLDESTDLVTTSVELKMNKENGTWTADEGSLNEFVGAVYGVGALFGSDTSAYM